MKTRAMVLAVCLGVWGVSFAAEESSNESEKVEKSEQGEKLILNKNFALNKKIQARYLYANIEVDSSAMLRAIGELTDEDRKSLTTTLNSLIEEARKGDLCKGGSYSITPIVAHERNSRKTIGQDVNFSLQCKFLQNEMHNYNALLSKINQIVSQNRLLVLPQPSVTHRITSDEIASAKEELFGEFLGGVKEVEEKYSALLRKKCVLSKVSAEDAFSPMPRVFAMESAKMAMNRSASTDTAAPIAREDEVHINVNVKLQCR